MNSRMKKIRKDILDAVLWIGTAILTAIIFLAGLSYQYTSDPLGFVKLFRTLHIVETHYAGSIDKQALLNGALEGIVAKLGDKHSVYLDGDTLKSFTDQMTGSYAGIGIYLGSAADGGLVAGVIDDSPASEADIRRGDVITAIDGTATAGMKLEDISQKIRGPVDTTVTLTVRRDGTDKTIELQRRRIHIKTVAGQMIEGTDIGYIRVAVFSENTGEEFTKQFKALQEQGMKKMILDLRDNPGGLVDQATLVASNFVPPESTIVSYMDSNGKEEAFRADGTTQLIPMVVLINENSASASEIVAGDVQDMKLGTIVGVKSYGKGTVQGVYTIDGENAVKLTVAQYKTTKGRQIDGIGIEPDTVVSLRPNDTIDYQLEKALEILKAQA